MSRITTTEAYGIRLPIISRGSDLISPVIDAAEKFLTDKNKKLLPTDIAAITESVVAKSQNNYCSVEDIGQDIRGKFGGEEVAVVFPLLSRNRFYQILQGISRGAKKVYVFLSYPADEVGNPLADADQAEEAFSNTGSFVRKAKNQEFIHPFTGVDYVKLYRECSGNIEVYVTNNKYSSLDFTGNILVSEIHKREPVARRFKERGAKNVFTLADVMSGPVGGSGYNPQYGVLGSNLSNGGNLKLFPKDCDRFIDALKEAFLARFGLSPELMIYGDGAFKDPFCGIWELADPLVCPACTSGLRRRPNEIKMKYAVDTMADGVDKDSEMKKLIAGKADLSAMSLGTTPRQMTDLVGSLCDLVSGSGDKGTPLVYVSGYFDNYADD